MRNLTYIPFTRNKYFYGKLLTAEDFELEQRYLNDKRRLVNRWLMGYGVVAGLEVIRVDDYNISLEMGLALDATGREIVVEKPVIKKLSMLDGFEEATKEGGNETLYLCIAYQENPAEPVHNITNSAVHTGEETEYNKYQEGYRLYVTDDEPEEGEEFCTGDEVGRYLFGRAERIDKGTYRLGIYLAKVFLIKAGPFYMIDNIEPLPFKQIVYSLPMAAGMIKAMGNEWKRIQKEWESARSADCMQDTVRRKNSSEDKNHEDGFAIAEGTTVIPLKKGKKQGNCYFSDHIVHGLGLGEVQLLLRIVRGTYVYSGAEKIFDGEELGVCAASRLNQMDGTFVIGIRLLQDTEDKEVIIGWTAVKSRSRGQVQKVEKRLSVRPGMINLTLRQDYRLEAACFNVEPDKVAWEVITPQGGLIGQDGVYHAPNNPGVYEVNAYDKDQPDIRASAFILVREQ